MVPTVVNGERKDVVMMMMMVVVMTRPPFESVHRLMKWMAISRFLPNRRFNTITINTL